jgi:hypothetical protein
MPTALPPKPPASHMFRALFLALGVSCCIIGLEALAVDRAVLKDVAVAGGVSQQVVDPPEWAPWSMMAGGAVVVLYSFTIPRRVSA